MSILVQTVVTRMCDLVGLNNAVGAPSPEDQALAVDVLNGLLGEWSSKGWINPKQYTGAVAPATNDHLIVGMDTSGDAPDLLVDLMDIGQVTAELGQVVYQMRRISLAEYERLSIKQVVAIPQVWAWDFQQPNGNIWLYPRPMPSVLLRVVGTPRITSIESQATIDLDPSYMEALIFNGACKLYPFFPRDAGLDGSVTYAAHSSLTGLKARAWKMRAKRASCGFTTSSPASSYWTSTLNTVSQ